MRLLADLIRGLEVEKALGILQFNPKHPAVPMYKLLKSAINNWEQKNSGEKVEDAGLIVKTIYVDGGRIMKRMRPAPQGRGYRIRKRSNHITIVVDSLNGSARVVERHVAAEQEPVVETAVVPVEEAPVKKASRKPAPKKEAAPKPRAKKEEGAADKTEKKPATKKTKK